jgi:hypothetical protein
LGDSLESRSPSMLDELAIRAIDISFYLPVPLVLWCGFRWLRASRAAYSPLKRRLTHSSLIMLACSSAAFAILMVVLEFAPPNNENARIRLIIRGVQVGFVTGVLGVALAPFTAKSMRLILACTGLLVSYHWYLLGNAY